jgi:hypothetical protein
MLFPRQSVRLRNKREALLRLRILGSASDPDFKEPYSKEPSVPAMTTLPWLFGAALDPVAGAPRTVTASFLASLGSRSMPRRSSSRSTRACMRQVTSAIPLWVGARVSLKTARVPSLRYTPSSTSR